MRGPENLTLYYLYLAVACGAMGIVITFAVLFICQYYNIDISKNLWVLAIPLVLSLFLNVTFVELYRRFSHR